MNRSIFVASRCESGGRRRQTVKMLSHFKVDPLFPLLAKTPRSGPLVLRNVGEPGAVSAGSLFPVPSHFHLLNVLSLPAIRHESKEASEADGKLFFSIRFVTLRNENTGLGT